MGTSTIHEYPASAALRRHDVPTIVAVAVVVYALASLLHEGIGHGGACVLTGGTPELLTSMQFGCTHRPGMDAARRLGAAAGTIVQLVAGLGTYAWYRSLVRRGADTRRAAWRYALWLFSTVNLLQGFGYLFFSGVGDVGDWATVFEWVRSDIRWRLPLAVIGFALYWATTVRLFRALLHFLDGTDFGRMREAQRLALTPYLTGGVLALVAGLRNPGGLGLLVLSGLAATLGGTSGLAWGPQTLRGAEVRAGTGSQSLTVSRSWTLIVLGVVTGVGFVWVLGPGIVF